MDIMKKAKERAILPVEDSYVMNMIYFTEGVGITSTSANHISQMATTKANDLKDKLKTIRTYRASLSVIGEPQITPIERYNTEPLKDIKNIIKEIGDYLSLTAWLREAIKERENALNAINKITLEQYATAYNKQLPPQPMVPDEVKINFNDLDTILGTGLTIKEYNRSIELNSRLALLGELIHTNGILTNQKKKLAEIRINPTIVKESGRDTLITTYETELYAITLLEDTYNELQADYRKLQAEKNGIDSKFSALAVQYQTKQLNEYKAKLTEYEQAVKERSIVLSQITTDMREWKQKECERISSLKIIIPTALRDVYNKVALKTQ